MKKKVWNIVSAVVLAASLTVGALPAEGLKVQAAENNEETVKKLLTIRESEINQLLTKDLELPTSVEGMDANITYSIEGQPAAGTHGKAEIEGTTLKVTRPYAGEGNYKFNVVATVTADGETHIERHPMTIREGLSGDSYAGYVYVCFSVPKGKDYDVQQIHFFLSEDGLNWTALNGCQPAFLAGQDYTDYVQRCGANSVNFEIDATDNEIAQTVSGDASVLFPFEGRDQGVRDPYLIRGCRKDGSDANKVWLLATDLNTHSAHYNGNKEKNTILDKGGDTANYTWTLASKYGVASQSLFVWETEDWVHWTRRYIDVGSEIDAAMVWAPEAIYNPEEDNYLVYWSGRTDADNSTRNRLYCAKTKDFKTFEPTKLYEQEPFFEKYPNGANDNDGYGNIDTSQLWVAGKDKNGNDTPYGTLYRVVKDETRTNNGNVLLKIQLMSADSVLDPKVNYDLSSPIKITPYEYDGETYYDPEDFVLLKNDKNNLGKAEVVYNWFINESTGNHFTKIKQTALDDLVGWHEGATMFKFIDRDEWCIMIDNYGNMQIRYEPYVTTDLSAEDSVVKMPAGSYGRTGGDVGTHGGMIPITVDEYNTLIKYYNDKDKMVDLNAAAASNYHKIDPIYLDVRPMLGLAEKLKSAIASNKYSESTKAQMRILLTEAETLAKETNVTDSTKMDNLTSRVNTQLANTLKYAKKVTLNKSSLTLCTSTKAAGNLKTTFNLKATLDVRDYPQITWESSNKNVAVVSNTGKVTAKKQGTAKITAKAEGGAKATCTVTVKGVPGKITLNKKSVNLKVRKKFQIKVKLPSGTVCSKFTYKSNKPKIAAVSKTGKVTAKKKGTAKITVKAANNSKAKATLTVKVKK